MSSISIQNKVFSKVLREQLRNRRFVYLTAQLGHDVEKGCSFRVLLSPLRLPQIVFGPARSKALQGCQQQQAIGSYRQSRMTRYGLLAAHLRLAYTQDVFLIAMIHLDLPSIKAGLNQQFYGSPEVGCQKVSGLAIVQVRVLRQLVRHRCDHDQPQALGPRSAFPQHIYQLFVPHHAPLASEVNPCALPGTILLRAHSVGSKYTLCVFAATSFGGPKAQPRILAAASQQMSAIQLSLEHRLVGEAAVADHQQPAGGSASLVETFAQVSNEIQRLSREILLLLQLLILLKLFRACAFARFLNRRCFLKSHRNPARRIVAFLMMSEQQRRLQKAQPVHEVHVKGGRQRITMPRHPWNLAAHLSQFGVVKGGNHRALRVALQVLIDHRVEQPLRLPAAPREHLVIGAPVLVPSAQGTERARDGAAAKHARQSDGMLDGALLAVSSGKRRPPSALKEGVKLLNQHLVPSFEPKDILIGAHETGATIDFLSESRNDRLSFEFESVQLVYALDDFRDVKRLAGASEYVMNHINLRRTFVDGLRLARPRTQPANGFELGFERDLDSMQYSSLDFIFFHRRHPPFDSLSGLQSRPRGYHNASTSVNQIMTYVLEMSKLQSPRSGRCSPGRVREPWQST